MSPNYNYKEGYVFMKVNVTNIPSSITVDGNEYQRKTEFHVSLLCVKKYIDENKR